MITEHRRQNLHLNIFLAVLATIMLIVSTVGCGSAKPEPTPLTRCFEDMPCWDCEVMGDNRCGLDPKEGQGE